MERGGKEVEIPWKDYLAEYVDESQHELIRRNVLLATRNFQHRMEIFKKEIIFGANSPLCVRHISYRVEFQVGVSDFSLFLAMRCLPIFNNV